MSEETKKIILKAKVNLIMPKSLRDTKIEITQELPSNSELVINNAKMFMMDMFQVLNNEYCFIGEITFELEETKNLL